MRENRRFSVFSRAWSFGIAQGICVVWLWSFAAVASPLDDQIEAFKTAKTQSEALVANLLKTGLSENREAEALAAVRPWLAANPASSQAVLYYAGLSMHYTGDWSDAVIFYRKLLKSQSLDPSIAGSVVSAAYRLLINDMKEPEVAYLLMREDGNRLRSYGRAKQFDRWFLRRAIERADWVSAADRLTAIYGNPAEDTSIYDEFADTILQFLERGGTPDEATVAALDRLATASAGRHPKFKVYWDWFRSVNQLTPKIIDLVDKNRAVPAELFTESVKAAKALVAYDPDAAKMVARMWSDWPRQRDDAKFWAFVNTHGDLKDEVYLLACNRLSPESARELLKYRWRLLVNKGARGPRSDQYRGLSMIDILSPKGRMTLARQKPAVVNALDSPSLIAFNPKMSLEDARSLAPILARNPHVDAALIRAYAAAGKASVADMVPEIMKDGRWRFADARQVVEAVWNSGADRTGADLDALVKQYGAQGARYDQIKKQVERDADSRTRLNAFSTLSQELAGALVTPDVLSLWKTLMEQAPAADKNQMLKQLTTDLATAPDDTARDIRKQLLSRAIAPMTFGNAQARIAFGPGFDPAWLKEGAVPCRKNLPELASHLTDLLRRQMQAGTLSAPLFGIWMHCVNPEQKDAQEFLNALVKSKAYAGLDRSYHGMAGVIFGDQALLEKSPTDPRVVSRELLALPRQATPQQVDEALKAVVSRVAQAPEPVVVYGLKPVAALPTLAGQTRALALVLFQQLAPLGDYPSGQGYEQLGLRLLKEMRDAKQFGAIVPYAASLWRAAMAPDNSRSLLLQDALAGYVDAAMQGGFSSAAFSIAQVGLRLQVTGGMRVRLTDAVGRAKEAMGIVEITGDENDPAYPILKADADFRRGELVSAWQLYVENDAMLTPTHGGQDPESMSLMRRLSTDYLFWLISRNIEEGRTKQAEFLVKGLMIWSRGEVGLLSTAQQGELQIAFADLAFREGNMPAAHASYRKVAATSEYRGTEIHLRAGLGSVNVDRVSQNFDAAIEELDRLSAIKIPTARTRVRYVRAEVLMDQQKFKEAFDEVEAVLLIDPNHENARILRGKIEIHLRRLREASEIELGVSREDSVIVPGESVKINLVDPMLNVSGLGADIEVEIWAKSGDRERVMLYPLGDSQTKYRANVPTALGPPIPGDKVLQVLGEDEIRFGYSKRFRAKLKDLPPDSDTVITIASDAKLVFSAGSLPPMEGERQMSNEELGLSSAQVRLGTRKVRPGNPVYLRVIDPDQSKTAGIDAVPVSVRSSSGDVIRRLLLKETGPYTGVFEGMVPTAGAQATAMASESAPGRDPNMSISPKDGSGWLGKIGDKNAVRTFTVDLNDNVPVDKMTFAWAAPDRKITRLQLEISLDGNRWDDQGRYPEGDVPWDGRPRVTVVKTDRGEVSRLISRVVPSAWSDSMGRGAMIRENYSDQYVGSLSTMRNPGIPGRLRPRDVVILRYRAFFEQKERAPRRFRLTGYPSGSTVFLINGLPADQAQADRMLIERELDPGLHSLEVWCALPHTEVSAAQPVLLCDVAGKDELEPCPDSMFDPKSFPKDLLAAYLNTGKLKYSDSGLEVTFDKQAQVRLVRLSIFGFQGAAPELGKVTLTGRDGKRYLPVKHDFLALNDNDQLEVLPGDTITALYEDPVTATPGRNRHEEKLGVAFNNASVSASFLKFMTTVEGRSLELEQIRRFNFEDAVAFVVDDVDMDTSPERDVIEFEGVTSTGQRTKLKAVETEPSSGRFIGRIFPVKGTPQRESELQVPEGGTLTLIYRDNENLVPGIPTDRSVTIEHAMYRTPAFGVYTARSEWVPDKKGGMPRCSLSYHYVDESQFATSSLQAIIRGSVRFDVVAPHLALAGSSRVDAYVQPEQGRLLAGASGKSPATPYDITVPGTKKLSGRLFVRKIGVPEGYGGGAGSNPPQAGSALDEGRFMFSVPLVLGDLAAQSLATQDAEESGATAGVGKGIPVKMGDVVHIGYAWKDEAGQVQWKTASVTVGSHAFMDVMNATYTEKLERLFVGQKAFVRVLAPGLDQGPERDWASVNLRAGKSGAEAVFRLRETGPHTGLFQGAFEIQYANEKVTTNLPPVELNGFPVLYGDEVSVTYAAQGDQPALVASFSINMGSDGKIEPFSKRFTNDDMAVKTSFTLAECFFELAKSHAAMEQESLARRQMLHAMKLLQEAIATHRSDDLRAHAEYLLGNLAQEFGDLAKNDESKLSKYREALAYFTKIPVAYPETEFADKAQFKIGLVYEKMGESEISLEEYVKLAYKYPDSEHIPEAMSRLAMYFQKSGLAFKEKADALRSKTDVASLAEVVRLDGLSYPQFIKAAIIYGKLQERFPDHKLAGLAGLASAQNYMRATKYATAIAGFMKVVENEQYDGQEIRAQALFWLGLSYERLAAEGRWTAGLERLQAKQAYSRVTFDFPDSQWAKRARGRLADPVNR
jgi:tetratricopeptide (TPR) repeat protein